MIGTAVSADKLLDQLPIVNERHLRRGWTSSCGTTIQRGRSVLSASSPRLRPAPGHPNPVDLAERRIRQKQVLGGLTHEYYIAALPSHAATERSRSFS